MQNQAETEARSSELRLRALVNAVGAVSWTCPPSGRVDEPQADWMAFTGQTGEEMMGDGWLHAVHPEDRVATASAWRAAVAQGESYQNEQRIRRHDGEWRWMSVRAAPIRDAEGEIVEWFGICIDITESKQAMRALRASERRRRAIFDYQFLYTTLLSPEGRIVEISDSVLRGTGVAAEDVIGEFFLDSPWLRDLPEVRARWRRQFEEALERPGASRDEVEYQTSDGAVRYALNAVTALRDDEGQVEFFLCEGLDITDRKRTENALRESEERLRRVSNNADVGLIRCSRDWVYLSANPAYAKITGKPLAQIIGRPLVEVVGAETCERIRPYVERALRGENVVYEAEVPFSDTGQRYLRISYTPDCDAEGRVVGWVACVTDITDRKAVEDALRLVDRRKDEFLAMLAHELRNPLAPIVNGLQILQAGGADASKTLRVYEMMARQASHLVRLVDDLLEVSRVNQGLIELRTERIDLAQAVNDGVAASQSFFAEFGHRLTISLPSESLLLDADPTRLVQVVTNLLSNACKFTEPGGRIEISARVEDGYAVIRVRDNGIGVPKSQLTRVFDLFSQIDNSFGHSKRGLGVGLALVRKLVELHGGQVEARSEGSGLGSEFIVRLPLPDAETAKPTANLFAAPRVLVVDDNRDVADSLTLLLETLDANARAAYGGQSALQIAAAFKPEVVFLDLMMPDMDGYETASRLRQLPGGRDLLLIALTGFGQAKHRLSTLEAGFDEHLRKPVEFKVLQELLGSLRRTKPVCSSLELKDAPN
ncbi:hybrid sensor histidine kinase/response regulator [Methylocystis bryophila]|uniref:histidine kinase n=1 Tax=Methylocystis bryophila TaxID=655015 RepID=A0A1W6MZP6_9HYPH|nr:PAS domain S-box protein [Methylocystis bryophila]ARN83067.1 hypothetical protein B1812_20490 [Methylocystis bryophila]BDV39379.1 hypothetical protein DSM21852_26320 [Methylocystis bryophila]